MPKASAADDERKQQAFREQLPDNAAPRRANRQADANLPLAGDPAREEQVGHVRAGDHQNQAECKKERHERQHGLGRLRDRPQPRFEHEARGRPLAGTFSRMPGVPHEELRERLIARHTRLQPPDNVEAAGLFASLLAAAEFAKQGERRPEVGRSDRESSKAFGHHADDVESRAVHQDGAVEYAGIARKMQGPGAMAEHDDATSTGLVVRWCERAPKGGAHAEHAGRSSP